MCPPCHVPKVLQPRRSTAVLEQTLKRWPPRHAPSVLTCPSICHHPAPQPSFLWKFYLAQQMAPPTPISYARAPIPRSWYGCLLVHFWYFYCPGYRGMYVQGVSSKSFKQNAAGATVPPINQQKPQYPLLLAISTKLGPPTPLTVSFLWFFWVCEKPRCFLSTNTF